MTTLQEYLDELGWSKTTLSKKADIDYRTAKKAVNGQEITARPARAIASSLSRALKRSIAVKSIDQLKVRS